MKNYNDFELIYLIQTHHNWGLLDLLFKKYKGLIYRVMISLGVTRDEYSDCLQISRQMLLVAVNTFSEVHSKTFTRYYEMILLRKIRSYFFREKTYQYRYLKIDPEQVDKIKDFQEEIEEYDLPDIKFSSEEVTNIYILYFKGGLKPHEISKKMNVPIKKVYNTLYQVKKKVKKELKS